MKKIPSKTFYIRVSLKSGSKYQDEFAIKSLNFILNAWKIYFESNHGDNSCEIEYTE